MAVQRHTINQNTIAGITTPQLNRIQVLQYFCVRYSIAAWWFFSMLLTGGPVN